MCAMGKRLGLDMHSYMNQIEQDEIIINTHQKKNLAMYQALLTHVFQELFRVLKNGKFMLVTFHNTKFEIRNAIITASIVLDSPLNKLFTKCHPVFRLKHYSIIVEVLLGIIIFVFKESLGIATPLISSQLLIRKFKVKSKDLYGIS